MGFIALGILALAVLILFIRNIRVVPQAHAFVIERLGTYKATWNTGLHAKMPFIDKVERRVSLKERVADFPPQAVITRDNVTMQIDTVVFYQIVDPVLYCYGIENPIVAIENLSATTLRNLIGDQLACKSAFPLLHHVGSHPRISSRIIGHFIAHSRNGKG
jgi:regulator of protease activity HflC (stomatin/prohibitin superfamily)